MNFKELLDERKIEKVEREEFVHKIRTFVHKIRTNKNYIIKK